MQHEDFMPYMRGHNCPRPSTSVEKSQAHKAMVTNGIHFIQLAISDQWQSVIHSAINHHFMGIYEIGNK